MHAHTHTYTHIHTRTHTHTHTRKRKRDTPLSLGRVGCFEHTLESRREPLLQDTQYTNSYNGIFFEVYKKDTIVMKYVVHQHHCRFRPPSTPSSQGAVPSAHLRLSDCLHKGLTLECRAPLWVGVPIHHTRYTHTRPHTHTHTRTHTHTHTRTHARYKTQLSKHRGCFDMSHHTLNHLGKNESNTQAGRTVVVS
jgi:hypothetical protein